MPTNLFEGLYRFLLIICLIFMSIGLQEGLYYLHSYNKEHADAIEVKFLERQNDVYRKYESRIGMIEDQLNKRRDKK